jgi:hypothetical protein
MDMKKGLILFSALLYVFFAFFVNAQTQSGDITFILNPQYPKANESVTASVSSYATDLNKAKISWVLDGQLSAEAVGQKNFIFKTGDSGTSTTIALQIQTSDGSLINKQITIIPADVDVLWETVDTYVPPFYKGKALMPSQGNVKAVAIPSSTNSEVYIYNWKLDENGKPNSSGYGKNSYVFQNSYLETSNLIEVSVSDLFGNNIGSGTTTIKPSTPKILFYEKDPIFGTKWEKSLDNGFIINPNGQTFVAEPYFFTPKNLNSSNLEIKWTLEGSPINTPAVKNELGIKPSAGQSGSSSINFSINNIKTLFLSLDKTLNVNF